MEYYSFVGWECVGKCSGIELPAYSSSFVAVRRPEFSPRDWVWVSAVRVPEDFVHAYNACGGSSVHQFGDVPVHVVVNMMVIPWGNAVSVFIKNSSIFRVGDCGCKLRSFSFGCWGRERYMGHVFRCSFNNIGFSMPQFLSQLLACAC